MLRTNPQIEDQVILFLRNIFISFVFVRFLQSQQKTITLMEYYSFDFDSHRHIWMLYN